MDKTRAFQRAIRNYRPGSRALAAQLDMSESTLAHKASPTYPTMFFSPEEGIHFQLETGDHGPLQVEAAALGYVLLPLPDLGLSREASLTALREFADYMSTGASAEADGEITGNELAAIKARCAAAQAALLQLCAHYEALHEQSKPAHLRGAP